MSDNVIVLDEEEHKTIFFRDLIDPALVVGIREIKNNDEQIYKNEHFLNKSLYHEDLFPDSLRRFNRSELRLLNMERSIDFQLKSSLKRTIFYGIRKKSDSLQDLVPLFKHAFDNQSRNEYEHNKMMTTTPQFISKGIPDDKDWGCDYKWMHLNKLLDEVKRVESNHIPHEALIEIRRGRPDIFWDFMKRYSPQRGIDEHLFNFTGNGDAEARSQFLQIFPAGSYDMISNPNIIRAVDERLPLKQVISNEYHLTTDDMKRFMAIQTVFQKHKTYIPQLMKFLHMSQIRSNLGTAKNMYDIDNLCDAMDVRIELKRILSCDDKGVLMSYLNTKNPENWHTLIKDLRSNKKLMDIKDYMNGMEKMFLACEIDDFLSINMPTVKKMAAKAITNFMSGKEVIHADLNALRGIQEYVRHIPIYINNNKKDKNDRGLAWPIIVHNSTLKNLIKLSDVWHKKAPAIAAKNLSEGKTDVVWAPLLGNVDLGDGITARELSSNKDLINQGKSQNHCVGHYASKIINSTLKGPMVIIFSIEKEDDVLSTAEIHITFKQDKNIESVEVVQHRGMSNEEPGADAKKAIGELVSTVHQIRSEAIKEYQQNLTSESDMYSKCLKLVNDMGCNVFIPGVAQQYLKDMADCIPKDLRNKSIKDIIPENSLMDEYQKKYQDVFDRWEAWAVKIQQEEAIS